MANTQNTELYSHLIAPFSHDGGDTSCLLLHGYTGSPSDMRPLGDFLSHNGYTVYCPLLPGHGTSHHELSRCRWTDWYRAAVNQWKNLKNKSETVILIGLSMGGALALHCAAHNQVDGVVTLASGTRMADWRLPVLPFVRHFIRSIKKTRNSYARGKNRIRFAYEYNPTQSTHELLTFYRHLEDDLPEITTPILIMHAKNDIIMGYENTGIIAENVRSKCKKIVPLEGGEHIITLSKHQDFIHSEILPFIQSI